MVTMRDSLMPTGGIQTSAAGVSDSGGAASLDALTAAAAAGTASGGRPVGRRAPRRASAAEIHLWESHGVQVSGVKQATWEILSSRKVVETDYYTGELGRTTHSGITAGNTGRVYGWTAVRRPTQAAACCDGCCSAAAK